MKTRGREGTTIVESILSMSILAVCMSLTIGTLTALSRTTKAGATQAHYIRTSRQAEQLITRKVQKAKAVGVEDGAVFLTLTNYTMASIKYVDADENPKTVEDNYIIYDPNLFDWDDEEILCGYVSVLNNEDMFEINPLYPSAVHFAFHIGDAEASGPVGPYEAGFGYQGVDVRFSATPRNRQYFYD
jgi:type II secretory pathway pseudopilin PulG